MCLASGGARPFATDIGFSYNGRNSLQHMTIKELIGITVQAQCDNAAVVTDLNQDYSKNADVIHFGLHKAKFRFLLVASHIPGKDNDLADALSRDNLFLIQPSSS